MPNKMSLCPNKILPRRARKPPTRLCPTAQNASNKQRQKNASNISKQKQQQRIQQQQLLTGLANMFQKIGFKRSRNNNGQNLRANVASNSFPQEQSAVCKPRTSRKPQKPASPETMRRRKEAARVGQQTKKRRANLRKKHSSNINNLISGFGRI